MAVNPSASAGSTNPFGVEVPSLDFNAPDAPTTKTYHGVSIVVNGSIIGRITSWQPSNAYTRGGEHVFELSHRTWGHPVDYVPGKAEGFTLSIARAEVWNAEMERALGLVGAGGQFTTLLDQNRPFTINEYLFRGQELYRQWVYRGCWFQDKNPSAYEAEGNGIISVDATIAYVSRTRAV